MPIRTADAFRAILILALLPMLGACAQLAYYAQLAQGQVQVLAKRESIDKIIGDESRDAKLRERLRMVKLARRFAVDQLALPDNQSYSQFTALDRPYVLWNVLATPELSLKAVESCFPIAGCLAYRGYYQKQDALKQVVALRDQGYDADWVGVPAYSTLGWFDDPLLSSMMHWGDDALIATLFHELAHQQLFVRNDTAFNESFASFVEQEGLRQFLAAQGRSDAAARLRRKQRRQFAALVLDARHRLSEGLDNPQMSKAEKRDFKQEVFRQLRGDYLRWRDQQWNGSTRYDFWFERPLNNARLLPFELYDGWVESFERLFQDSGHQWPRFHAAAKALGKRSPQQRTQALRRLKQSAASARIKPQ